jgi:hypothetical protein
LGACRGPGGAMLSGAAILEACIAARWAESLERAMGGPPLTWRIVALGPHSTTLEVIPRGRVDYVTCELGFAEPPTGGSA